MKNRRTRTTQLPTPGPVPAQSRYRYAKRHYRIICSVLDHLVTPLVCLARSLEPEPPRPEPRSILVVQLDHLGDAVLTTPMLGALRERFPAAAIDMLASAWNSDVFRGNPHVRQVHVSEHNWHSRGPAGRSYFAEAMRLGRLLRPFGYDLGIDPRGDLLAILVLWLAGIPRRLGWTAGGGGFLLTDTAPWNPVRHEIESRMALLEPLGVRGARLAPELFPSWSDRYTVREWLAALPEPTSPVVVIHTGAGTAAKRWPVSHLVELTRELTRHVGATVVLVGERRDRDGLRQWEHRSGRVMDWTGRLSLMQLAALLQEVDLFIGADSGPAHMAAAMGTPSVVLFSGTNRVECWRPWGTHVRVLRRAVPCSPCHIKECPVPGHPCMTGIRPGDVVETVRQMLRTSRRPIAAPRSKVEWPSVSSC